MNIKELIRKQGYSISFEFFPPKTREDEDRLFEAIARLETFEPTFVSVTYGAGGGTAKNTSHIIERILKETHLNPMPHLTCIEQSEAELKEILVDYQKMGVKNILALRGDPPKGSPEFIPGGMCYAKDLVKLVRSLGTFSIGVAVYPEGHLESPNLDMDMLYTKEKIDAGADFAITQMFFDNHYFYEFMERAEKSGIYVPVIPGIMPITDIERIRKFCKTCGTTLPISLARRMEEAPSPEEARKIGIDFAVRQVDDLMHHGVRYFHFYTMNRADVVSEILNCLSLEIREKVMKPVPA